MEIWVNEPRCKDTTLTKDHIRFSLFVPFADCVNIYNIELLIENNENKPRIIQRVCCGSCLLEFIIKLKYTVLNVHAYIPFLEVNQDITTYTI